MKPSLLEQIRWYGWGRFIGGVLLQTAGIVLLYSPIIVFFW